jgi:ElaB/YqjD/DUF883 family membrane-anchored ribosome-binding protein
MADPQGGEQRTPQTQFSDPSHGTGTARDPMEAGAIRETAQRAADATRQAAEQLGSQAGDMAGRAYQAGQGAVQAVGRRAAEQPWLAVGVGFAVGYLLAYLAHGGRRWS